ncbi:putative transcriptional regulatory protein TBS1 [Colletotrichum sp. SAR 10_77]|nr:putative transcriptional regulatory protein TBS1 [Colletotrichum sp. SAR 10_77]
MSKGIVLLTGLNGFIAARAAEAFLQAGYSIRGTVRARASAKAVVDALSQYGADKLEVIEVPDIAAAGAFDEAVKGVHGIVHLAQPATFDIPDPAPIMALVKGSTIGILESASKSPSVKSVILLSSAGAVGSNKEGPYIFTEKDWNDAAVEAFEQLGAKTPGAFIYLASKVIGEREFWKFREERKPSFTMTALNPVYVTGPPLTPPETPEKIVDSARYVWRIMSGAEIIDPPYGYGWYVDVRDVAKLILFAVERADEADGERYISSTCWGPPQAAADILRPAYPRLPIKEGKPGEGYLPGFKAPGPLDFDGSKALKAVGQGFVPNGLQVLQAASDAAAAAALQNVQQHLSSAVAVADGEQQDQQAVDQQLSMTSGSDHHQQVQQQQQQQQPQTPSQTHPPQLQQTPQTVTTTAPGPSPSPIAADASLGNVPQGAVPGFPGFAPMPPLPGSMPALPRDPTVNPKLTRLRRACDMCSQRKVKCDEAGPPCRPCRELNVDCTFNRELKRRGPPNKHAEAARAARRQRLEPGNTIPAYGPANPTPSPHNAAQALVSIAEGPARLDAEAIAPMPILELLVDDFFTYIHPLAPFPHEPTFRHSFANREDRTNPEFLGLLASMIGALVASFPRSARQHLKTQHSTHLFPRAIVMIEKCRDIALDTRGARWAVKQPKTLDDAATSYFLGLAAGYTFEVNRFRYFTSECLALIRELGFHRPKHPGELPTFGNDNCSPDPLPFHHIKDQIGKRIFWCLLLGVRSFSQLGASHADLVIAPSTPGLPYPALPENVDDLYIMANEIVFPSEDTVTLLTGYRFAIEIYTTMNAIVSVELVYGMNTLPWSDQRPILRDALVAAKEIIDRLPTELQLSASHDQSSGFGALDDADLQYVPPAYPNSQPPNDVRNVIKNQPQRRRQLQYEIQKANIYISQLATRSFYVELYFNLRDVHLADPNKETQNGESAEEKAAKEAEDSAVFELMTAERELIVQNLLHVLGSISQRNLEPNGGSLINKIRQVASTLLNDAPERKGPVAMNSEEALMRLIDVLLKLEGTGPSGSNMAGENMTPQDEEEEMRNWAHLRDYQQRFAAHGGFAGNL